MNAETTRRPLLARMRAAHAAAAPASTLLVATLLTLLLATFARFATARVELTPPTTIHVSPRATPGGTIEVAVEAPARERVAASLPGLSGEIPLAFDAATGFHLGRLDLPEHAPDRGWCTVRVVFDDRVEHDLRVDLVPPGS